MEILKMNGASLFKLFLFLSLGFHVFAFSLLSILFPDIKITPFQPLHIEVSLLPLTMEKRELLKKVEKRIIVRSPELRVRSIEEAPLLKRVEREEETKITQVEKGEVTPPRKEQEPITLPPAQNEMRVVSISESKPSPLESEKKEMENRQEEGVVVASLGNPILQSRPSEKPEMAMKSPALSESDIIFVQPRYAENPRPLYPREAKRKGYEGEVLLRVEVLSNGRVGEIEVKRSSGYDLLDRSAMIAVKQWRFIPAKRGETPVPAWVNIPIAFQLR